MTETFEQAMAELDREPYQPLIECEGFCMDAHGKPVQTRHKRVDSERGHDVYECVVCGHARIYG